MNINDKIFVAGHNGMVGSAVVRVLIKNGYKNLILRSHKELDLTNSNDVINFYKKESPDIVIVCAARVGGIGANQSSNSLFLYENEMIAMNTIWNAYKFGVKRLLFLGSTCIYPRLASQPILESELLTGKLETTNEGYAIAKISGLKLCEFLRRDYGIIYHSLMPTNLYGPGDNYNIETSHVLPAMIHKFETARLNNYKNIILWGTGSPLREFLHVDDLANACIFMLKIQNPPNIVNVGSGEEISIYDLANKIKTITGCSANIVWDSTKPDGTPRKLCDTTLIRSLGWKPRISLNDGIIDTVINYRKCIKQNMLRI